MGFIILYSSYLCCLVWVQVNDAEALATSVKLGRTTEDSFDYVSFEDDRNPCGDANMTEVCFSNWSEVKVLLL